MPGIYLLIEGQQQGPYTKEQVRQSLAEGLIPNDLLAWREGLDEWAPVSSIVRSDPQPPPVPPHLAAPLPNVQSIAPSMAAIQSATYPWYRSSVFVGLIIGIPWLLGPFWAVLLKPFMIAGLILMASGPIYYSQKGELKTLHEWSRWLAGGLLILAVPYYVSILLSTFHPSSNAIVAALRQDDQLGKEYLSERESIHESGVTGDDALDQVAQVTSDLVSKMKSIPISDCPSDFQEAYKRHINCWSDYADAIAQHPHIQSGDEAVLEGFLRGLSGDPTGGAFEKQDEIDSYLNTTNERDLDIRRSWEDVQAVAIRYGIKPDQYSDE